MSGRLADIDIVHCHTWYTHFAGCLVKQLQGVPLVLTTHSLEPHRPWKVEQLGTAYHASTWIERTAYQNADGVVAVSEAMKHDVQRALRRAVGAHPRDPQRHRPRAVPADARSRRARVARHRPRRAVRAVRRPHHAAEGHHPPRERDSRTSTRACRSCCAPARRIRPRSPRDERGGGAGAAQSRNPVVWIAEMLPKRAGDRALHARGHLRLPVDLRAVRHHQPRSDGVRDARRGLGGRRHSRGRRARRDRPARGARGRSAPSRSSRGTRSSSRATSAPR
jgi:hypothetical protein